MNLKLLPLLLKLHSVDMITILHEMSRCKLGHILRHHGLGGTILILPPCFP